MIADGLEDRTDLGLPAEVDPERLAELRAAAAEAARAARWAEANLPSGPPASGHVIARERARFGRARTSSSRRLLSVCPRCRASAGRWCRGRVGELHPERTEGSAESYDQYDG
jgi:hypothetical protein